MRDLLGRAVLTADDVVGSLVAAANLPGGGERIWVGEHRARLAVADYRRLIGR